MKQWLNAIQTFTDLCVFVVNNVMQLRDLIAIINTGDVRRFDIILVKNGHCIADVKKSDSEWIDDMQIATPLVESSNNGRATDLANRCTSSRAGWNSNNHEA